MTFDELVQRLKVQGITLSGLCSLDIWAFVQTHTAPTRAYVALGWLHENLSMPHPFDERGDPPLVSRAAASRIQSGPNQAPVAEPAL